MSTLSDLILSYMQGKPAEEQKRFLDKIAQSVEDELSELAEIEQQEQADLQAGGLDDLTAQLKRSRPGDPGHTALRDAHKTALRQATQPQPVSESQEVLDRRAELTRQLAELNKTPSDPVSRQKAREISKQLRDISPTPQPQVGQVYDMESLIRNGRNVRK